MKEIPGLTDAVTVALARHPAALSHLMVVVRTRRSREPSQHWSANLTGDIEGLGVDLLETVARSVSPVDAKAAVAGLKPPPSMSLMHAVATSVWNTAAEQEDRTDPAMRLGVSFVLEMIETRSRPSAWRNWVIAVEDAMITDLIDWRPI